MIRFLHGDGLQRHEYLAHTMFEDRTKQFRDRLKWDVQVNSNGEERDEYDRCKPVYIVWENADGSRGGSARFLPTTGPTMYAEHFPQLIGESGIHSPYVWECTRFCLARRGANRSRVASGLLLGSALFGLRLNLDAAVAIYDAKMQKVYRSLGWSPATLAESGQGPNALILGAWYFNLHVTKALSERSGIPQQFVKASIASDLKELIKTV
jgi:N-acyl-L-homoserine lactone synthetase